MRTSFCATTGLGQTESERDMTPDQMRIVLQQDAPEPMLRAEVAEPIEPEALIEHSIGLIRDLPIDVYASDVNHAGGVYYRSKVAEPMLSRPSSFRGRDHVRMAERLQSLVDRGTDPLEIYCGAAHEAGKAYAVRLRMNDLHDVVSGVDIERPRTGPEDPIGEPYYYTSTYKQEHPEYLMGDVYGPSPDPFERWQRSALNYALGPVRSHVLGMVDELVTGYDIDVLELDFIRFAFVFRRAEAFAQRHVLTSLIRRIKEMCHAEGKRRGRPVYLSARVPDSLELGLRAGIDTREWLRQGLLDLVVIGGGYSPLTTEWENIADEARSCGVTAQACLNHGRFDKDVRRIRASALRAFEAGVSGLVLWNFWYCFDYYHPRGENPLTLDFTRELAEPDSLGRSELAISLDPSWDPLSLLGGAHSHHSWPGQVPMMIGVAEDGFGQTVTFDVPEAALKVRVGAEDAALNVEIENYWAPDDEMQLFWNDRLLPTEFELRAQAGQEVYRLTAAVPIEWMVAGSNRLELRLVKLHVRVDPFVRLLAGALQLAAPGN